MSLPLQPPVKPQLALSRKELPVGEDYVYEIKLDGFRCLAFVDGDEVFLQSRSASASTRPSPVSSACPSRPPLSTWSSICLPERTSRCWSGLSPSAARRLRSC